MKLLLILGAISGLLMTIASLSWAKSNLNSSRSNIYRIIYDDQVMTQSQATAIGGALDKMGQRVVDETTLRGILKDNGVQIDRIKRVIIEAARSGRKDGTIILLESPADEARARRMAVSDSDAVGTKAPPEK